MVLSSLFVVVPEERRAAGGGLERRGHGKIETTAAQKQAESHSGMAGETPSSAIWAQGSSCCWDSTQEAQQGGSALASLDRGMLSQWRAGTESRNRDGVVGAWTGVGWVWTGGITGP